MNFIQYLVEKYGDGSTDSTVKKKYKPITGDMHWVTIYPGGKYYRERDEDGKRRKKKGIPILIKGTSGEIVAGMGGKFNGEKITDIHKDSPVVQKQEREEKKTEALVAEPEKLKEIEKEVSGMDKQEMVSSLEEAVAAMNPEATTENSIHNSLSVKRLKLSEDVERTLKSYTGSGFRNINKLLRGEEPSSPENFVRKEIERIDVAMGKAVVKKPFYSYRGMNLSGKALEQFINAEPGDGITDNAFVSTSTNPYTSFSGNVKLKIIVPKGARAISLKTLSSYKHENEILLDRGGTFRVLKKEVKNEYSEFAPKSYHFVVLYEPNPSE